MLTYGMQLYFYFLLRVSKLSSNITCKTFSQSSSISLAQPNEQTRNANVRGSTDFENVGPPTTYCTVIQTCLLPLFLCHVFITAEDIGSYDMQHLPESNESWEK